MIESEKNKIVQTVLGWFYHNISDQEQKDFFNTPKENLALYHHTLGTEIRNHFNLWKNEWTPVLVNGIDESDEHPDAISMRIIEAVWQTLHDNRTTK